MSHTIKVTRRITTTTTIGTGSPVMGINTDYLKKVPGILQLIEWIIGAVVVALCAASSSGNSNNAYNYDYTYVCLNNRELFLLDVAIACLVTTILMFAANLFHQPTSEALPKTMFELLFHCIAFLLYLIGAITVMVAVNRERYWGLRYTELLIAAIFALVNTILYLISAIYSFKSFRGEKI